MNNHHQIRTCDTSARSDQPANKTRPLTYDEQKAAEAAFGMQPFNPVWSHAAFAVYAGITAAMSRKSIAAHVPSMLDGCPGMTH